MIVVEIKIKPVAELSSAEKNAIKALENNSFGDKDIFAVYQMAEPSYSVSAFADGVLAGNVNLVERSAKFDDKTVRVVGINNLVVDRKHRNQGVGRSLIKTARNFMFDELQADWSLLVCSEELVPFYQKLRWTEVKCPLLFDQPNEKKIWREHVFVVSHKFLGFDFQKIDLCGLPW